MWYVYIIESSSSKAKDGFGYFYIGISTDTYKRLRQHNGEISKGAKYTENHRPWTLIYTETYDTRSEACKREYELKQLSRSEKVKLVGYK